MQDSINILQGRLRWMMNEKKKTQEELSSDEKFEKMWEKIKPPEWSADTEPITEGFERKALCKEAICNIVFIACAVIFIAVAIIWGR